MATINELLYDSITLQSNLVVTQYDIESNENIELYNGDAENIGAVTANWMDAEIAFIYADVKVADTLHIELESM